MKQIAWCNCRRANAPRIVGVCPDCMDTGKILVDDETEDATFHISNSSTDTPRKVFNIDVEGVLKSILRRLKKKH